MHVRNSRWASPTHTCPVFIFYCKNYFKATHTAPLAYRSFLTTRSWVRFSAQVSSEILVEGLPMASYHRTVMTYHHHPQRYGVSPRCCVAMDKSSYLLNVGMIIPSLSSINYFQEIFKVKPYILRDVCEHLQLLIL